MNIIKKISIALFVLMLVISFGSRCAYQKRPSIPKKNIPANVPADVRKQIEKLYSSDPIDRGYGVVHLGEMRKKAIPAVPFLIGILNDRTRLLWSSGATYIRGGKIISDGEPTSVRQEAVLALGKIGDARAVEPLCAALKDRSSNIRQHAASALGKIGDARAVEPLVDSLKNEHAFVKRCAAKVLKKITGQEFGENQAKWRDWWNKNKDEMLKNR